jgi:alkyl hydroperoxide reductase subunit AhpF
VVVVPFEEMGLLSEQDRRTVASHLQAMTQPVTVLFFSQTIGASETVLVTKQILDEVASLSDRITVEEVNVILDRDRAAAYGIEQAPAIVLLRGGQEDTGIRFLGAPAGYEFMALVEALILAGSGDSGLSAESRALIAEHVKEPLELLVFSTPT